MDALKGSLAVFAVVAAILCPIAFSESEAAGEMDGLMLYQVQPFTDFEGVAVHNYGSTDVDLKNYAITDMDALNGREGKLTFDSIIVKAGETLVLAADWAEDDDFSNQPNTLFYSGSKKSDLITTNDRFLLNDDGDDVYLFLLDGRCVDAVCYGDKKIGTASYWTGEPADDKEAFWIQREGNTDTNTAADWFVSIPGRSNYEFDPDLQYDATVTPFLFPDSGGIPVYRALESAEVSIRIEMYQLLNYNVLSLICDKASEGVDVDILLEGNSLASGYTPILDQSGHLKKLLDLGGEVRIIGVSDSGTDRYTFDHAKFAIIDGKTTVVTSENWTSSNLNGEVDDLPYEGNSDGNRGWGAVIDSLGYSTFMTQVFENDWSKEYGDVKDLLEVYPNIEAGETYYNAPTSTATWESFKAKVTPVLSSDNSYDALEYYVSKATERAYSQQQSLDVTYTDVTSGPLSLFASKAAAGVDARVIFSNKISISEIKEINAESNIKAALMTSPTVHNKGIICDDISWVSSINWTQTSFFDNREVCVVIHSAEVADYFAKAFLEDFDRYYTGDGMGIEFTEIENRYDSGKEITISVRVTPESGSYTYTWDLGDGSPVKTSSEPRIVATPKDGTHTLKVTVTNSDGISKSISQKYTVGESSPDTPVDPDTPTDTSKDIGTLLQDYIYYIIAGLIFILGIIAAAVKGGRHR